MNIWKVQLAYHLATGKFSKIQNEFILEILTSILPETYASRANLTNEEKAKAVEMLESSIFKVFTREETFAIFEEIGIQKYVEDEPTNSLNPPVCNCNSYCSGPATCYAFQSCTSTGSKGCGIFGDSECSNMCRYP